MDVFPAIDLLDGHAVRLHQGRYDQVTVYEKDPTAAAKRFRAHARWLHVVDLQGARTGVPAARDMIARLVEAFDAPAGGGVQVGGGVRTAAMAEAYLALGAARVVLGTAAAAEPDLVADLCTRHPGRVVVALDARDGIVATDGWEKSAGRSAVEMAEALRPLPIAAVLYTDVARDGTRSGPNLAATARLCAIGVPVLASGGVGSLDDLRALAHIGGVVGAIVGRALYDGVFGLAEAVEAARGPAGGG